MHVIRSPTAMSAIMTGILQITAARRYTATEYRAERRIIAETGLDIIFSC